MRGASLAEMNALVAVLEQRSFAKAAQHRSCRTRPGRKIGPDQFEADLQLNTTGRMSSRSPMCSQSASSHGAWPDSVIVI
jgi:hypothetical protein